MFTTSSGKLWHAGLQTALRSRSVYIQFNQRVTLHDAYVKARIDLVTSIQQTACSSSAPIDNELGHLQAKACNDKQAGCVSRAS